MPTFEDDCLCINLPSKWTVKSGAPAYHFKLGRSRDVFISFLLEGVMTPQEQYDLFKLQFKTSSSPDGRYTFTHTDPFLIGPYEGFRVDSSFRDEPVSGSRVVFLLDEAVLMIDAYNIRSNELTQLWKAIESMVLKPSYRSTIGAAYAEPEKAEKHLDATDLTKPRRIQFKTWMDHQMILLRGDEADDATFDALEGEGIPTIIRTNESILWITSETEWDVTLEFIIRQSRPTIRKRWWTREDEASILLPDGKLCAEQTTGGLLLEVTAEPGLYDVWVRAACQPEEKIQVILTPKNAG